jgi:hypothetical protein
LDAFTNAVQPGAGATAPAPGVESGSSALIATLPTDATPPLTAAPTLTRTNTTGALITLPVVLLFTAIAAGEVSLVTFAHLTVEAALMLVGAGVSLAVWAIRQLRSALADAPQN